MQNSYWLNKWQACDIPFHEAHVNADLITYINTLNLNRGDNIFVPLCGKTKDMLWLAEKEFNIFGVELSPIACNDFFSELNIKPRITQLAKFTKYQHSNIELFCGNLFDLTNIDLPPIHAVYDCKALIALPPDSRKKYYDHIINCIGTKIKILLLTRETTCQVQPPPFPISEEEVNLLYGSCFDVQLLKCSSLTNIPERLLKKGYIEMTESVYVMSENIPV